MKKLHGVVTAMVTPFDEHDRVDTEYTQRLTDWLIRQGVNGLYPCGTTGEMLHMTVQERKTMAEAVLRETRGRCTVDIHTGCNNLRDTIELSRHALESGADGIGVVTPQFFGCTERELINYYLAVSDALPEDFPIYLYNIPQCSGVDLPPEVVSSIVKRAKNVVGIKYSSPNVVRTIEYLHAAEDIDVLQGSDKLFASVLQLGCSGVVSGVSCVFPEPFVRLYRVYNEQNLEALAQAREACEAICDALRCGAQLADYKASLEMRGLGHTNMREPLLNCSREECDILRAKLEAYSEAFGYPLRTS